jgi:proline iminopeptidase
MTKSYVTTTVPLSDAQKPEDFLYPALSANKEGYLEVSKLHSIWFAEYGNPNGVPVVALHGGPAAGCNPMSMRIFDPAYYRIILHDQRGAPRSKPLAEFNENTTQDLIADLEKLRQHLNVDKWIVVGGSWGSTLALAYGQTHPGNCLGFILRGVFLGRKEDSQHLWYGTKAQFPDEWQKLNDFIPPAERNDLIKAYHTRILNADVKISEPAIQSFVNFDLTLTFSYISPDKKREVLADHKMVNSIAKGFLHYSANSFFLHEGQLLDNLHAISHLPCTIVHGRYDALCRLSGAFELHQQWPNSQLVIVSNAGHASTEPGVVKAMVEAADQFKS